MTDYHEFELEELHNGLKTGFIDSAWNSNLAYRPEFISNDYKQGKKVLSAIEDKLRKCEEFCISVAFITKGGITPLLQILKDLEQRNIPGKILTTDYLMFSSPEALDKLAELKNIELKMFCTDSETDGFHTKGYIFRSGKLYQIIIGSSNMTLKAITANREWNTKIVSTEDGAVVKDILNEFNELWNDEHALVYNDFIENYRIRYRLIKEQQKIANQKQVVDIKQFALKPNKMQVAFIKNLLRMQQAGEQRALLLSSTGTGKTLASAFALREMKPKKALFIVHREQIAKQAIKSYQKVFGDTVRFGLLSGNSREFDADYLFSTMQMMAKPDIYSRFAVDEFDVIVIDEVHHAGAESYQRIMEYFKPAFWLGMTASPDTNNYDIYSIFNHKIAYEIRLQQALEEKLLCPFHYFGITDLELNGEVFDDNSGLRNFNMLVSDERVKYIIEKADYYGYSGDRVKGLVFCSRKDEAKALADGFNKYGCSSEVLTGEDSQERREAVIERLTNNKAENRLDYIFTVDIFNEGVDIPEINQVIMLRPTESPVVFIQQLGRGLRKIAGKEYVVILDFIGNYTNNFMIPIALSGDRTYIKDNIRKYVMEGSRIIPGSSTIHFDEISKKRIFESIDKVSTTKRLLTEKYMVLKNKLGKIPGILDFYEYGEIDPLLFINYADSYHNFLMKVDKAYTVIFDERKTRMLEFVAKILVNGKRPHELVILELIINSRKFTIDKLERILLEKYRLSNTQKSIQSAINVLCGEFINTQSERKKYEGLETIVAEAGYYGHIESFYQLIQDKNFLEQLSDLVELGLRRYDDLYANAVDDMGLSLYQKYSRKDVCRILNWEKDESATVYGYKIKNGTCPIFVTYNKQEDIASSTKYEDSFVNNKVFSWMTRSRVSENSIEAQKIINYEADNLKIMLFVKKSDGEGTDFYYMGQLTPVRWEQTSIINDAGKKLPIMNFQMELQQAVREDMYDYFTN